MRPTLDETNALKNDVQILCSFERHTGRQLFPAKDFRIGHNPIAILSMGAMALKSTIDMRNLYFGNCEL